MRQSSSIFLLAACLAQAYAAPQFITLNDGKLGVNFGGYHAAVGIGGGLGSGAGGGLFAEAGTPFGQAAKAGLGGAVDGNGGSAGGLYAGATAGGNVKASAGLGGGVTAEKSGGAGYASAQAGDRFASSGLGGESSAGGSSGFTFSGTKSFGLSSGVVKHKEVAVQPVETVEVIQPVEVVKPVYKTVQTEIKTEAANEVNPLPLAKEQHVELKSDVAANVNVEAQGPPTAFVKEVSKMVAFIERYRKYHRQSNFHNVMSSLFKAIPEPPDFQLLWRHPQKINRDRFLQVYVQQPPQKVYHKEIIRTHYKPHRHHFRKTAYFGGHIGAGAEVPPPAPVVYKVVQPAIEKRVDVGVESASHVGGEGYAEAGTGGTGQIGYTKQITYQRNPQFFADIFNIPISTLKAVGNFLGNAAGSTSVSVQKSASVHAGAGGGADSESLSSKHDPSLSASSLSSSDTQLTIKTPPVSKFIDDIFSIPINTLSAVNKFLENNVPARKSVQISPDGEPTKVRLGPHARRRANKQVVIVEESNEKPVLE